MKIRGKFYVAEVNRRAYNPAAADVVLRAVTRGDGDNAQWATSTPTGELKMTVANESAAGALADLLGEDVYLDITPVGDVEV